MSRRKDRWTAISLPALARAQAKADRAITAAVRQLPERAIAGAGRQLAYAQAFEETDRDAAVLEAVPCYWVTAPMATVAMDASLDVPEIDVDRDMPSPSGFIAFEKPLPPLPLPQNMPAEVASSLHLPNSSPVSALLWRGSGSGTLSVTAFTWSGHLPAGYGLDASMIPKQPLLEITTIQVPRTRAELEHVAARPQVKALLAFLSASWILMMTPTVASRKQLDPKTGGAPRPDAPASVPLVTTIDLRPLRHEDAAETEPGSGRAYKHRFIVRGHWRNQAHGPGYTQRRMAWIPSHIKGPEDAPLLATEKVMVWRR